MHLSIARSGLLTALVLATTTVAQQSPATSYHLRILDPLTPAVWQELESRFDVLPSETGVEVIVLPGELAAFKRLGLKTKLLARGRPYADIVRNGAELAPDARYYTPAEIIAKIDSFVRAYPKIAQKVDLSALPGASKTHENRSIFALKISDNVARSEDEPAIVLAAQHHARELGTPVIVFGAMDRILKGYANNASIKALVDGYELYLVPCVNPDGVNHVWTRDNFWRKNKRNNGGNVFGVDLNRNYPFLWGRCGASSSTRSSTYKGPTAGSEPESRTMMALNRQVRPEIYLDFHSTGQEVLFTYAPCASVQSPIRALIDRYKNSLRTPMRYATRNPSASGEAPEWHWGAGGTMSFLTEITTRRSGFQPNYNVAVAEEVRVWPGIQTALTRWRPAVRGHVTSIFNKQPIAATITYTPNRFNHGEKGGSRPRDGRYSLWLPLGTHQVHVAAPGFRTVTKTVRVTSFDTPQTLDVVMVPNTPAARMSKLGSDRIGTRTTLTYTSPGDVGEQYWIVLSLGTSPGIPVGAGRVVPLNPDVLFFATVRPNAFLTNNVGRMPASGRASAGFPIPNIPAFIGLQVHAGGITVNSGYLNSVKNFSAALPITIKR